MIYWLPDNVFFGLPLMDLLVDAFLLGYRLHSILSYALGFESMTSLAQKHMLYELAVHAINCQVSKIAGQLNQARMSSPDDLEHIAQLKEKSTALFMERAGLGAEDEVAAEAILRKYAVDPARVDKALAIIGDFKDGSASD
jgi:hypothetical protein